jgi:hypothetical protein
VREPVAIALLLGVAVALGIAFGPEGAIAAGGAVVVGLVALAALRLAATERTPVAVTPRARREGRSLTTQATPTASPAAEPAAHERSRALDGKIGRAEPIAAPAAHLLRAARLSPARRSIAATATAAPPASLTRLVLAAFAFRVILAFVLNLTPAGMALATDSYIYDKVGRIIAESWSHPTIDLALVNGYHATSLYLHLAAAAHWVLGGVDINVPMSLMNAALGAAAAYNLARVAHVLYGERAARTALLLAGFFPSIAMWTSLNLREGWSFFTVSLFLLAGQRLRERFSVRDLVLVSGAAFLMVFIRPYVAPMLAASLALSYGLVRLRQLPVAVVVVALASVFLVSAEDLLGFRAGLVSEASLETLQNIRAGMAYGNSAYGAGADTTTVAGALAYLPVGVAYFLGAPFPWSLSSWRQVVALPETLAWYFLFYAGGRQLLYDARTRLTRAGLMLVTPIVMVPIYGLIEGNEGTAYRHRAQVMLLFFVLAAGYLARRASEKQAARAS